MPRLLEHLTRCSCILLTFLLDTSRSRLNCNQSKNTWSTSSLYVKGYVGQLGCEWHSYIFQLSVFIYIFLCYILPSSHPFISVSAHHNQKGMQKDFYTCNETINYMSDVKIIIMKKTLCILIALLTFTNCVSLRHNSG